MFLHLYLTGTGNQIEFNLILAQKELELDSSSDHNSFVYTNLHRKIQNIYKIDM